MRTPQDRRSSFRERLARTVVSPRTPTSQASKVIVGMVDSIINSGVALPDDAEHGPLAIDGLREPAFRVALLGPSRIGKTSLIAAMLRAGQVTLDGTQLVLRAADDWTNGLIRTNQSSLKAGLDKGRFDTEVISATTQMEVFRLVLRHAVSRHGMEFSLLDFPGRLFENAGRLDAAGVPMLTPDLTAVWNGIREHLVESNVLIIPADALAMMEAVQERYSRSVPTILEIDLIAEIIEEWVRVRKGRESEPALVVLAPVRCESYFPESGRADRSAELRRRTLKYYRRSLDLIGRNAPHARVLYCPVETLGNVRLVNAGWPEVKGSPGLHSPVASFAVRRDPATGNDFVPVTVRGAQDILVEICRLLAETQVRMAEAAAALHGQDELRYAGMKVDLTTGIFRGIWNSALGRLASADSLQTISADEAEAERRYSAQLAEEIRQIADQGLSERSELL